MTPDGPDETTLAEAWVAPNRTPVRRAECPAEDHFWDAASNALDVRSLNALLDHTATCSECALALRTAVAVRGASPLEMPQMTRRSARHESPWDWLARTILRPEAALAYLVLLALAVPASRILTPPREPDVPALRGVRTIGLESATVSRGGLEPPAPVVVAAARGDLIVFRLFLDREDLVAGAPLHVRLASGEHSIADQMRFAGSIDEDGTLEVSIDANVVPREAPLRLTVMSGPERVFERSLLLSPEPAR